MESSYFTSRINYEFFCVCGKFPKICNVCLQNCNTVNSRTLWNYKMYNVGKIFDVLVERDSRGKCHFLCCASDKQTINERRNILTGFIFSPDSHRVTIIHTFLSCTQLSPLVTRTPCTKLKGKSFPHSTGWLVGCLITCCATRVRTSQNVVDRSM